MLDPRWASPLGERVRRHLVLKAAGTSLIIGIFFVAYLHLLHQPHSAWSTELEIRPWVERF